MYLLTLQNNIYIYICALINILETIIIRTCIYFSNQIKNLKAN